MKKVGLIVVAAALLGFVQYAQSQEVTSVNVVGFYKVTVPPQGKFALCAVQFDTIDPVNQNLLGILGTNNLTKNDIRTFADQVYVWNTAQMKWQQYYEKADGLFYNATNTVNPTNPPLFAGDSFFIQTRGGATSNLTVTFAGQVVDSSTITNQIVAGLQPKAYPFSSATGLADMSFAQQGTANDIRTFADNAYVYDSTLGTFVQYYLKANHLWYKANGTGPFYPEIPLGQGFWYEARHAFGWAETNKYLQNL
jgi:hypothetical protein